MTSTSVLLIPVPYFQQQDNASGQGWRECFSSSAAMLAAFWGRVDGDDRYNRQRARFGDTTDPLAQLAALRALGLDARFRQDATAATLETELRARRPVAVGWLHRGHVLAPAGGGHWGVIVGFDSTRFCLHDPYGEPDLIGGGHLPGRSGKAVWVSRRNWLPRWQPGGSGGWCVTVSGPVPF